MSERETLQAGVTESSKLLGRVECTRLWRSSSTGCKSEAVEVGEVTY